MYIYNFPTRFTHLKGCKVNQYKNICEYCLNNNDSSTITDNSAH